MSRRPLLISILFLLFITSQTFSQIPNGSFEQWTNAEPNGWYTNNARYTTINLITVTQTNDSHSGNSALRGEAITWNTGIYAPIITSGKVEDMGIPVSERHASLNGFYKFSSVEGDLMYVLVLFYKNEKAIGIASHGYPVADAYTNFSLPILYTTGDTPDRCLITISFINETSSAHAGSVCYLDDIAFEGTSTSIEENTQVYKFGLSQNYPNPFNPNTRIDYQLSTDGFVSLKIHDLLGNEVATLKNNFELKGKHSLTFNASNLASGIYFYQLKTRNYYAAKKLMIIK